MERHFKTCDSWIIDQVSVSLYYRSSSHHDVVIEPGQLCVIKGNSLPIQEAHTEASLSDTDIGQTILEYDYYELHENQKLKECEMTGPVTAVFRGIRRCFRIENISEAKCDEDKRVIGIEYTEVKVPDSFLEFVDLRGKTILLRDCIACGRMSERHTTREFRIRQYYVSCPNILIE